MNSTLTAVTMNAALTVGLVFGLASCGHAPAPVAPTTAARGASAQPASEPVADSSLNWQVRMNVPSCSDREEHCFLRHGFELTHRGAYRVGEEEAKARLHGRVTAAELKQVHDLIGRRLMAAVSSACTPTGTAIELRVGNSDPHPICAGSELSDALMELARKYYPTPFPNTCTDAAAALERDYEPIRRCSHDADCELIDANYLPVLHPGENALLDDCTYIPPLVAANGFESVAHQKELLLRVELAQRVCGAQLHRPNCEGARLQNTSTAIAVCENGSCRARTAEGIWSE